MPTAARITGARWKSAKTWPARLPVATSTFSGVMVESHLVEGRQDLKPGCEPCYGLDITDACIGWDDTERLLATLSAAVLTRRQQKGSAA